MSRLLPPSPLRESCEREMPEEPLERLAAQPASLLAGLWAEGHLCPVSSVWSVWAVASGKAAGRHHQHDRS